MSHRSLPFLIHVPHASVAILDSVRSQYLLNPEELDHELLLMTDRYTDELFDVQADNIQRLIYPVSRLVVDPERFRDDTDEPMAARGMGAVYMKTAHGQALRGQLSDDEHEELLQFYYDSHHAELTRLVSDALDQHGNCLIIDAHSFPSKPLPCDMNQEKTRPDICIGTDGFHTPKALVELAENVFLSAGWSVGIDWPYRGALVPIKYYGREKQVTALMIEVNRALYMDEKGGRKLAEFDAFKKHFQQCLRKIAS